MDAKELAARKGKSIFINAIDEDDIEAHEWAIVLDATGSEADEETKNADIAYKELMVALLRVFGAGNIKSRPKGTLDTSKSYIKVTSNLQKLELYAEKQGMELPVSEVHGGGYLPFKANLKQIYLHPGCDHTDENEEECKCCLYKENNTPCECNLFLPYQIQVIIENMLNICLGFWAQKLTASDEKLSKSLVGNLAISWIKKHTEVTHFVDLYPLHMPNKERDPKYPNIPTRGEFMKQYCEWNAPLTAFTFSPKSVRFLRYLRNYFGEKIAISFAFLHWYNTALIVPVIAGIITALWQWADKTDNYAVPLFCILVSIWSAGFLIFWQRKQAGIAMHYNMRNFEQKEKELDSYAAQDTDIMTGFFEPKGQWVDMSKWADEKLKETPEIEPLIPKTMRLSPGQCPDFCFNCFEDPRGVNTAVWRFFQQFASMSTIIIMVAFVVIIAVSLLVFRLIAQTVNATFGGVAAGACQAIAIAVLDIVYKKVAIKLNDWEKHRTATIYEDHLIVKIFLFQFINSYFSLFYIAFIKGQSWQPDYTDWYGVDVRDECKDGSGNVVSSCMAELSAQLTSLLITRAIIGNFFESGLPWLIVQLKTFYKTYMEKREVKLEHPEWDDKTINIHIRKINKLQKMRGRAEREFIMGKYSSSGNVSGTFDEYAELAIQFGYVTLFAPAFPLAALVALISNIIENATDTFKILFGTQRSKYAGACDMGTWFGIFRAQTMIAILTNAFLIGFTSSQLDVIFDNPTTLTKLIIVILAEHAVFAVQFLMFRAIPNEPGWVRITEARVATIREIEAQFTELKDLKQHEQFDRLISEEEVSFDAIAAIEEVLDVNAVSREAENEEVEEIERRASQAIKAAENVKLEEVATEEKAEEKKE